MSRSQFVRANYAVNATPQFRMLSADQCAIVVNGALEVLERTGAAVGSEEARRVLADAGCWVDGERVRIPSQLAQWAIDRAPSRIVVGDRDGKRCLFLEESNVYFGPGPSATFFLDPVSGERRVAEQSDVAQAAIVADALPNVDFAMDMAALSGAPAESADVRAFQALVENTTKPLIHWASTVSSCQEIIDIAAAVRGSAEALRQNPYLVLYCESTPPLGHPADSVDKALLAAKAGVPVIYVPCTFGGSVAPMTMAGSLVVAVADFLVGLVVGQLASPGAAFIMGGLISTMQMQSSVVSHGGVELSLLSGGLSAIAHSLGIPVFVAGGCSDAKVSDTQMSLEAAFSLLVAGLSGANLVHGMGYMESGLTSSLDMLVMDDEIVGMVKTILGGIAADEDGMAVDVIDEIGPGGTTWAQTTP